MYGREERIRIEYTCGFFRIGLAHDNLKNMYTLNFQMMQHHGYSLSELEDMIPWEREIYIGLLLKHVEEEKQRMEEERQKIQSKRR